MKEVFKCYEVYVNGNEWRGTYESYAGALTKAESLKSNKNLLVEIYKCFTIGGKIKRKIVAFWN